MPQPPFDPRRRRLLQALGALPAIAPALARSDPLETARTHLYRWPTPANGDALVGRTHVSIVRDGETLHHVARRFDLGYWDILLANPDKDFWLPGDGTPVIVPRRFILPDTPRQGIVINAPELRLYYYGEDGRHVDSHPIGIGRQDWGTPLGTARVTEKIPQPAWYPPASIRAEAAARGERLPREVPPGPDNPLGAYALILDLPGYLIHGTNRPAGVGMRVSHGCVRLYPEDIAALFPQVPRGAPVHLVHQPVKTAWSQGRLWVEAHPLPTDQDYTAKDLRFSERERNAHATRISNEALERGHLVDRNRVAAVLERPTGVPTPVTGYD
ncbi:L,D-transpeptidase family protein [Arhodomonas sp. SL1]|uniref:L,D-transpeptidase family protein n=1 Tax=Arhodomonas sp. SL1 TaxID=3425691 RepID=UPI003F8858A0